MAIIQLGDAFKNVFAGRANYPQFGKKAKSKLAKLHAGIAAIRSDALHPLTANLTRRFHTIGIEDQSDMTRFV